MKKICTALLATLLYSSLFSQAQNPWQPVEEHLFAKADMDRRIVPNKYKTYTLDEGGLKKILDKAPLRFTEKARKGLPALSIPMPDGAYHEFLLVEAPVMHPELAAKFPEIKTFVGSSNADPTAVLRCGISHKGFHGMVLSANHSTVYIDVYADNVTDKYICYFKKDFEKNEPFECRYDELEENQAGLKKVVDNAEKAAGDCQFRVYQLALACTGEYAQFHGGTKPSVMAAFNLAMARVNGIFERDLNVTMVMIPNNDQLIFLNASSDPYTNNDGGTMLGQNQTTVDNIIGGANYDIGHVFSTGGGGIAYLGVTCNNFFKAGGVTGLSSPTGDPFYVDYVAHEMGHQFGANHTQNNDCNRAGPAAVEPGSASTIMGYAGICPPNVQNNSDDHFHAYSIDEMAARVVGFGGACTTITPNGNSAPAVTVPSGLYNVPVRTPFVLTANGSDPDSGNELSYCWEQMDSEVATMPPLPGNTGGPAFRSFSPTTSPSRYFPNINAIIANTSPTWEVLPAVTRQMDFRCTVRDNNMGGGCTAEADVTVKFSSNAGPFLVTEPNTSGVVWESNLMAMVEWDVANTNAQPINASTVDIFLSVDGGQTYPYTLASNVLNNGSREVEVPDVITDKARVMVKGWNNVFFDISNQNFTIQMPAVPTFIMDVSPLSGIGCPDSGAVFNIQFESFLGFNENVSLTATGLPAGATASFSPTPANSTSVATMTILGVENLVPGTYPIGIEAEASGITRNEIVELVVLEEITAMPGLTDPPNEATGLSANGTTLGWQGIAGAVEYVVEVATDPGFQNVFLTTSTSETSIDLNSLEEATVYYWRVNGTSPCAESGFSSFFAFQTGNAACLTYESNDTPKPIPPNQTSKITVNEDRQITSISLSFDISHTWVGDLTAAITSPDGTTAALFDQPGDPAVQFGCDGDDMSVVMYDLAANTANDLENTCNGVGIAIEGEYQPIDSFTIFNGMSSLGAWTLTVDDLFPTEDDGSLDTWTLEICSSTDFPAAVLLQNDTLFVPEGQSGNVTQALLETQGMADQTNYTLVSLPQNGMLDLQGTALNIGDHFTQTDINMGLLAYTHDGSMTTSDGFTFDVVNDESHWLPNQFLQIQILQNTLAATAEVTQSLDCHNDADGIIVVTPTGGYAPLGYSINGGAPQAENVFEGLAAGTYDITVSDVYGFAVTTTVLTIFNPPLLTISAMVNDDDIAATGGGGTGALSYSLNGTDFQSGSEFTDQANGEYTVYVMDENGCTATAQAIVAVNTIIVSATQTQAIHCFGESSGTITVQVGGGTPAFEYSLNGVDFQNSNIFANLPAGDYTITVKDSEGFTQTDMVSISQPTAIMGSTSTDGYEITIMANGGTGNLQYSLNGGAFQDSNVFYPIPSGDYAVVVMDENGCELSLSAIVDVAALDAQSNILQVLDCFEDANGIIEATATGGVPPYQYSLNGGAYQDSNVFENLPAGDYAVTVKDSGGFTFSATAISIIAPPAIAASANILHNEITISASGGTGTLLYQLNNGVSQASNVFTDLPNGNYAITVSDENGCMAMLSASVNVPALQVIATVGQHITCYNDMDGAISISASGGVPPYQYSINGTDFQSSPDFTGLAAGVYQPVVIDSIGQELTAPDVVIENPDPVVANGSAFGPTITIDAMGGTGNLTYSFDNGPFQNSSEFDAPSNGIYNVVVSDDNGCTASIEVVVNSPDSLYFIYFQSSCANANDGGITIDSVSGGYPPYLYSINGGPFGSDTFYGGLAAGDYTITVKDGTGYEWNGPTITISAPPLLTATVDTMENTLTINANGGTGNLQFSIDGGQTFQSGNVFPDLDNGNYDIVVMDENSCTATATATINFTSTNEAGNGLLFKVIPNPSAGIFNLNIKTPALNDLQITVHNAVGQIVHHAILFGNGGINEMLDLGFLANGQYLLRVTDGEQWGVKRLVILK